MALSASSEHMGSDLTIRLTPLKHRSFETLFLATNFIGVVRMSWKQNQPNRAIVT